MKWRSITLFRLRLLTQIVGCMNGRDQGRLIHLLPTLCSAVTVWPLHRVVVFGMLKTTELKLLVRSAKNNNTKNRVASDRPPHQTTLLALSGYWGIAWLLDTPLTYNNPTLTLNPWRKNATGQTVENDYVYMSESQNPAGQLMMHIQETGCGGANTIIQSKESLLSHLAAIINYCITSHFWLHYKATHTSYTLDHTIILETKYLQCTKHLIENIVILLKNINT